MVRDAPPMPQITGASASPPNRDRLSLDTATPPRFRLVRCISTPPALLLFAAILLFAADPAPPVLGRRAFVASLAPRHRTPTASPRSSTPPTPPPVGGHHCSSTPPPAPAPRHHQRRCLPLPLDTAAANAEYSGDGGTNRAGGEHPEERRGLRGQWRWRGRGRGAPPTQCRRPPPAKRRHNGPGRRQRKEDERASSLPGQARPVRRHGGASASQPGPWPPPAPPHPTRQMASLAGMG